MDVDKNSADRFLRIENIFAAEKEKIVVLCDGLVVSGPVTFSTLSPLTPKAHSLACFCSDAADALSDCFVCVCVCGCRWSFDFLPPLSHET